MTKLVIYAAFRKAIRVFGTNMDRRFLGTHCIAVSNASGSPNRITCFFAREIAVYSKLRIIMLLNFLATGIKIVSYSLPWDLWTVIA